MLKIFSKISQTRINHICKHISTTSFRCQGSEVIKARQQEDGIRAVEKKPQRPPLAKNFFLARIDTDLLAYPEAVYENEQQNKMKQRRDDYADFLEKQIFDNPDDLNNIQKLKEYGAFRSPSVIETETMFSVCEPESKFLSYGTFLSNHRQVTKIIKEFGDSNQQLKYLERLESGEMIATPCLHELKISKDHHKTFITEVKYRDPNDPGLLNGEKSFVLMSPAHKDSTLFLVVASVETTDHKGDFLEGLSVLLVDGSMPGVTISSVDKTIGFGEKVFNQVTVSFKDVQVERCE
jgi:hypothetical protein